MEVEREVIMKIVLKLFGCIESRIDGQKRDQYQYRLFFRESSTLYCSPSLNGQIEINLFYLPEDNDVGFAAGFVAGFLVDSSVD